MPGVLAGTGWLMCGQGPARGTHSARGGPHDHFSAVRPRVPSWEHTPGLLSGGDFQQGLQ